jgi:histidinol dehydrogenase
MSAAPAVLQIIEWDALDAAGRQAALARPVQSRRDDIVARVADIIATVRREGDDALRRFTEQFDRVRVESFAVTRAQFAAARRALQANQIAAIEQAIANVERFHTAQLGGPLTVETMPGVLCERIVRPIQAVGLYVPASQAPLPSAVIMLAVPARIAGCPRRVLCTGPRPDGQPDPAVLVAAELCGIDTVFCVGGAQAIAAMAYGTQTVPKVDKIFGPGSAWVTAAKQLVAADPAGAACDLPAGPSEVLVIADENARPAFVAADLLAQAEHDTQAQAVLVTSSRTLAQAVVEQVHAQMARLSRNAVLQESVRAARCIVVKDLDAAVDVSNEYAPEHLIVHTRDPRALLPRIQHAGSIFLGEWTPEPMGDYCSGTNHVLPTYGYARAYSGLSLDDFVKRITVQELTPDGLRALGPVAVTLAELEGLDAHARAVSCRLDALARPAKVSSGDGTR